MNEFKSLRGVIVPIVTPFDEQGRINAERVHQLVNYLIERGVHGIFPAGTTGEGTLLQLSERMALAEVVIAAVDGRVPVVVHTGDVTTENTLALTDHARHCGADAVAIVTPYYFRVGQRELVHYYQRIARQFPELPIYLYNIPQLTGNNIDIETVLALVESNPNIVGMKDSGGSLHALIDARLPDYFNSFSGSDANAVLAITAGIDGCVSGNANIVPELVVAVYEAAKSGDILTARRLQHQLNLVRAVVKDGSDLSLYKLLLAKRSIDVGHVRGPLLQASEAIAEDCWHTVSSILNTLKGGDA